MGDLLKIAIVVIIIIYIISTRNEFERLRRSVKRGGSEIGIWIEKRADCLNDALKIARIGYRQEVEGIERLTAHQQLEQLVLLGEQYPTLGSTQGYTETLQRAFGLNEDIAASRVHVNGNIEAYNNAITAFPGMLVASIFRYKPEKFIDEENIESNKKLKKSTVDFSEY